MLALVTGRRFGLNMTVPCDVVNFFRPNQYDWILPEADIAGKPSIELDDVNSALKVSQVKVSQVKVSQVKVSQHPSR
jgi:hypothetical protein